MHIAFAYGESNRNASSPVFIRERDYSLNIFHWKTQKKALILQSRLFNFHYTNVKAMHIAFAYGESNRNAAPPVFIRERDYSLNIFHWKTQKKSPDFSIKAF
jgi:hypothetical protein